MGHLPPLTDYLGAQVRGPDGGLIGKLADLGAKPGQPHPVVSDLRVRVGRRERRDIPWSAVRSYDTSLIEVERVPERVPDGHSVMLARDVLDVQIVDVSGKRLMRVADVELAPRGGALRVVALDVGLSATLRRLGLRRLARRLPGDALDWADVHLTSGRGHALHLGTKATALHRLHARDLAELVARLPAAHEEHVLAAARPEHAKEARQLLKRQGARRRFGRVMRARRRAPS